jgi:hypothetical protein
MPVLKVGRSLRLERVAGERLLHPRGFDFGLLVVQSGERREFSAFRLGIDDLLSRRLVGVPGTGGVAMLLYTVDGHTFGGGLLECRQAGNFRVEYGYALAYEHVAQLLAVRAGLGRHLAVRILSDACA